MNLLCSRLRQNFKSGTHHCRPDGSKTYNAALAEAINYRNLDKEGWAG